MCSHKEIKQKTSPVTKRIHIHFTVVFFFLAVAVDLPNRFAITLNIFMSTKLFGKSKKQQQKKKTNGK